MQMHHLKDLLYKRSTAMWVFFLYILGYGFLWVGRIAKFGDLSFGYDTGIYQHYISGYAKAGIINDLVPNAFHTLTTFVSLFGFSTDHILFGGYIASLLLLLVGLYYAIHRWTGSVWIAFFVTVLSSMSPVIIQFLLMLYYRNVLAIALCFMTLGLLKHVRLWALLPFSIVCAIHPITGGFLFIVSVFTLLLHKKHIPWKMIGWLTGMLAVTFGINAAEIGGYIVSLIQNIQGQQAGVPSNEFTGQFMSTAEVVKSVFPYIPFAVYAFFLKKRTAILPAIIILVMTLIFILFHIPFYTRLYIFFAIAVIALATISLSRLPKWLIIPVMISWIIWGSFSLRPILETPPIFSEADLVTLQAISAQLPTNTAWLAFSSQEAPWVYGYGKPHPVIAPGMFEENKWDFVKWQTFWNTTHPDYQDALLAEYEQFDYICVFASTPFYGHAATLFQYNPRFTKYTDGVWCYQ